MKHVVCCVYTPVDTGIVKKRTVANLTDMPEDCIAAVAAILGGHPVIPAGGGFETTRTTPHGHVHALLATLHRIGLDDMIASKPCGERSIIIALVVERLLHGTSKLAAARSSRCCLMMQRAALQL